MSKLERRLERIRLAAALERSAEEMRLLTAELRAVVDAHKNLFNAVNILIKKLSDDAARR